MRKYTPEEKLELVLRSFAERNVVGFCLQHGLDRSTLYAWRHQLADAALAEWRGRRSGRPRGTVPGAPQPAPAGRSLWSELARELAQRRGLAALLGLDGERDSRGAE